MKIKAAPGKFLYFCGIRVWKEISAQPTGYIDSALSYNALNTDLSSALNPDLSLAYPAEYAAVVTIQDNDPEGDSLDLTLKVRPWSVTYSTSTLNLALEHLLQGRTCWPYCRAVTA